MIRRWLSLLVAQAVYRGVVRVAMAVVVVAAVVAAAPVSAVAAGGFATAWYRGWPPRRLMIAAAWCVPMVAAWLAASGHDAAAAPYHAWLAFWRLARSGAIPRAAATIAPAAVPLGLVAGSVAWSYRIRSLSSGAGGLSPASAVVFDQRQWRHQARAARARITAPGSAPLTLHGDLLVAGAVIRAVGHRVGELAAIGYQRMRSHQVIIGTTGTGNPAPEV